MRLSRRLRSPLRRTPLEVRLQEALRKPLKPRIRMRDAPGRGSAIIFQNPVLDRQMLRLENILHLEPLRTLLAYHEANSVSGSSLWQSRTGMRIAEIAGFEFNLAELNQFSSSRKTSAAPCSTQRQSCRMRQSDILGAFSRRKEGTGHKYILARFYAPDGQIASLF